MYPVGQLPAPRPTRRPDPDRFPLQGMQMAGSRSMDAKQRREAWPAARPMEAQPAIRNIANGSVGAVVLYDVDAETCRRDVSRLLGELVRERLVTISNEDSR